MEVTLSKIDVDKPDDQVEGWGEEATPEKVPVSD